MPTIIFLNNNLPYFLHIGTTRKSYLLIYLSFVLNFVDGYKHCTVKELECIAKHAADIIDVTWCSCELGCSHTVYEVEKLTDIELVKQT